MSCCWLVQEPQRRHVRSFASNGNLRAGPGRHGTGNEHLDICVGVEISHGRTVAEKLSGVDGKPAPCDRRQNNTVGLAVA